MAPAVSGPGCAISSLARSLSEVKDFFTIEIAGTADQPNLPYAQRQHLGKVALAGTSFSAECFGWAVPFVFGRLVDTRGVVAGGGPFTGLQAQLERIQRGESDADILLWEMVERMYLETEWLESPVF